MARVVDWRGWDFAGVLVALARVNDFLRLFDVAPPDLLGGFGRCLVIALHAQLLHSPRPHAVLRVGWVAYCAPPATGPSSIQPLRMAIMTASTRSSTPSLRSTPD